MRLVSLIVVAALAGVGLSAAAADEKEVNLKPGPGLDKVQGNCGACHTLAYIQMNSPFLNAAGWNAEVTKMIKAYGAPIDDADAKDIVDYLTKNYGV
jgi:mono/diheme cytochrome c family protein